MITAKSTPKRLRQKVRSTRGDFKNSLKTPVLKYFDVAKVKSVDDRKRHITVETLLTTTSGMNSEDDEPYQNPSVTYAIAWGAIFWNRQRNAEVGFQESLFKLIKA